MSAAQISHVFLTVVFLLTGAVMLSQGHTVVGATCMVSAGFGWSILVAMLLSDTRVQESEDVSEHSASEFTDTTASF